MPNYEIGNCAQTATSVMESTRQELINLYSAIDIMRGKMHGVCSSDGTHETPKPLGLLDLSKENYETVLQINKELRGLLEVL